MPKAEKMGSPQVKFLSHMELKYPEYANAIQVTDYMMVKGLNALDKVYPVGERICKRGVDFFSTAKNHQSAHIWPMLLGFCVCFFGGCFAMLIAVVEVVYLTTWDTIKKSIATIYENYLLAREASLKDDMIDDDGNGIPDVQEISGKELFSRKLNLFLRSVDPVSLKDALHALLLAFFAILAALKNNIANTLVFACGLADIIERNFSIKVFVDDILPPEHKKLSGIITMMFLNFISVTIAMILKRYVMTLQCALFGATMMVRNAITIGKNVHLVEEDLNIKSQRSKRLITLLACFGFLWQASNGFSVPFPLNILLFPVSLLEWFVGVVFTVSVTSGFV
ncbi:hypothetical protein MOQ_001695 [Trypanosoma cruzi marinkellei]|uniref:Uncharacterized protein n=1 Tax=Trypanosoma cruzi marinkellei TaxID=85056 RepID=K2NFR9_TRYCR|nr:hypothetical protein MOQ_001695 [Trypanosoma cruzi marinkellei]